MILQVQKVVENLPIVPDPCSGCGGHIVCDGLHQDPINVELAGSGQPVQSILVPSSVGISRRSNTVG